MKKIFNLILFTLFTCAAFAQMPGAATSFTVNGLKVIFKPTVKEVISVRMYFRGGVYNYPADQAGVENLAFKAATGCGTKKYSADAFRDLSDKYGISIGGSSTYDYGNIGMECISKYFDQGWDLLAEAINNPVFDDNEVQLLKNKLITQVSSQQADPDKHLDDLLVQNAFAGTPYATDPDGTPQSLTALSAADLKNYYYHILNKDRMFIIVAGKITREQLEEKVKTFFANLPSKPYTTPVRQTPAWTENNLSIENRALATNYIAAAFNAPPADSKDFLAYRMGISALGGSLFSQLRTKMNLSYDPGASTSITQMPYGEIQVSTNYPKEAVTAMVDVVNKMRDLGISADGLNYIKSGFITSNFIKQQGSGAVSSNLGSAEINGGWEYAEKLPELINSITVDDINNALRKYIGGLRWTYLGDARLANEAKDAFNRKVDPVNQ